MLLAQPINSEQNPQRDTHTLVAYGPEHTCLYRFSREYAQQISQEFGRDVLAGHLSAADCDLLARFITRIKDPEWETFSIQGMQESTCVSDTRILKS
jgi:hypothetical protein